MRRTSSHETSSQLNADWIQDDIHDQRFGVQKRAKSDSNILTGNEVTSFAKDQSVRELLASLRSTKFCGQIERLKFDHSLKHDEWIRLPSGRRKGDTARLRIIPTPKALYDDNMNSSMSCDHTISSGNSGEWCKKRSMQEISNDCDPLSDLKYLSLGENR